MHLQHLANTNKDRVYVEGRMAAKFSINCSSRFRALDNGAIYPPHGSYF